MEKTGLIFAIFLIASLFLSISVVHAQPEHSESYCQVSNVDLNSEGEYLEIKAGGRIEISLDYEIWNRIGCPGCIRQIVIGLNREPLLCVYNGVPGIHPGKKGQSRFTITAPTEPGTYVVRWMCASMNTCNDAKDKYRESDYLGYTIGTIKVTDNGHTESYCNVISVDLNGRGDYLEIEPGEKVEISLDYEIWNGIECPGCIRQIVIGLNREPLFCAYHGIPGTYFPYPGNKGHALFVMAAPTEPGTYIVRWMCASMNTCNDAKDKYRESDYLGYTIGTIKVIDNGHTESYCEVSRIDLNGQGNYLEVEPGETITMDATYKISDSSECPGCIRQIVIGLGNGVPLYCAYNGIPGIPSGIQDGVCKVTAPTEIGTYNIMWMCTLEDTCDNAKAKYTLSPSLWKKIGTIKVIDDVGEDWECIHYKRYPRDDYEIINMTFYQRGNDLRVHINETGKDFYGLRSGSVTISVPESIDILYSTGNVMGLHFGEDNYREINPGMSLAERSTLFVAGLLEEKIGVLIGIVQFGAEVVPDEPDWYDEKDDTGRIMHASSYFDWYERLNRNDNVIIPWHVGLSHTPVCAITVDCPKMQFPGPGIYDIVFRVDYATGWTDIRYDVALPIKVS